VRGMIGVARILSRGIGQGRLCSVEPATALGLNAYHFQWLEGLREFLKERGVVA
jgi:hypothetical protein